MEKEDIVKYSKLSELLAELDRRPFYIKWFSKLKMFNLDCRSFAAYYFFRKPKNVLASNRTVSYIKDDIEFGYDLEMIYNKILYGAYDNDPYEPEDDWFETNKIDWKIYLNKKRVTND